MVNLSVNIKSEEKSYPIFIENEEISVLSEKLFALVKNRKYLAVISEKVDKLYGKALGISQENKFILKDGEKEKNFTDFRRFL